MSKDPFGNFERAKRKLPRMMFDFIDGGTGSEFAQHNNQRAFQGISLNPRVLINIEDVSLDTSFLGCSFERPFGIAPMGMCNLISPHADQALSRAAAKRSLPHCVSTAASTAMERSYDQANGNCWFQLYAGSDEAVTFELVDRAQASGFQNLIFTVDTPRHSRRTRDLENGFSVPLNIGPKQFLDFASHPTWSMRLLINGAPAPMNFKTLKNKTQFVRGDSRGAADWQFLDKLRQHWKGKLLLKGINNVDDASRAKDAGCDAIYVSNHGGRQLDSVVPAINTLPHVRKAVGADYPIVFDSGVRSADDIVRALALGANFVMLGRPILYALGADGPEGLNLFLDRLEDDLKSVMAQIGVTNIQAINLDCVAQRGEFHNG